MACCATIVTTVTARLPIELARDAEEDEEGEGEERDVVDHRHVEAHLLRVEEDGHPDVAEDGGRQDVEHGHGDGAVGRARRRLEDAQQVEAIDLIGKQHEEGGEGEEERNGWAEDDRDEDDLETQL